MTEYPEPVLGRRFEEISLSSSRRVGTSGSEQPAAELQTMLPGHTHLAFAFDDIGIGRGAYHRSNIDAQKGTGLHDLVMAVRLQWRADAERPNRKAVAPKELARAGTGAGRRGALKPELKEEALGLNPDGSLVPLKPGSWFVCFVPAIDKQLWHRFVHKVHKHVFALRPERDGNWTVFEPWWTRMLVATIPAEAAAKFLRWGAQGDVLLVREGIPGHSSQLRGMMACAALAAHMLGRTYFVWTPHQLYRRLLRERNVCRVGVSALLQADLKDLAVENSRGIRCCEECHRGADKFEPGRHKRSPGVAKPFCMKCARDL